MLKDRIANMLWNLGEKIEEMISGKKREEPGRDYSEAVISVIRNRRSVKKYLGRDVSDELIEKMLDAASHAPSAGNLQPYEFIVVKNEETRKYIAAACNQHWMAQAPVHIIACSNTKISSLYEERGLKLYGIQDTALASENLILAAESLNLRNCWVGAFDEARISILLHCPEHIRPAAIITLGYSDEKPRELHKHGVEKFAHSEIFEAKWKKG